MVMIKNFLRKYNTDIAIQENCISDIILIQYKTRTPGFSLFECYRQKPNILFCKYSCVDLPHGS